MNYSVSVCLATLAVVGLVHSATIPSDIKGCKRSDPNINKCVAKSMNRLFPIFLNGDKKYGVPVMDPFLIEKVSLSEKNGQGLEIALNFKDVKVKGLKECVFEDGTTVDTQKQTIEIHMSVPTLVLDAIYNADGKILLLAIKGAGDANLTVGELKGTFVSGYSLYKGKDGKDFAKLGNSTMDFTVGKFNLYLDNLFNGDKRLGDQMNIFLNENWQEVLKEFGPILRETIRSILFTVISNISLRVPFDVMFPK